MNIPFSDRDLPHCFSANPYQIDFSYRMKTVRVEGDEIEFQGQFHFHFIICISLRSNNLYRPREFKNGRRVH